MISEQLKQKIEDKAAKKYVCSKIDFDLEIRESELKERERQAFIEGAKLCAEQCSKLYEAFSELLDKHEANCKDWCMLKGVTYDEGEWQSVYENKQILSDHEKFMQQ